MKISLKEKSKFFERIIIMKGKKKKLSHEISFQVLPEHYPFGWKFI